MRKELKVGKNYGEIFGVDPQKGQMIYNGGISWTAKQGDKEMTKDSQSTTDNALAYINQPTVKMGDIR